MEYMSDTLFISGKKKRTATVYDIFEKIAKGIKKKGPTKNWVCELDEENCSILIDFNDEKSETFILSFGEKMSLVVYASSTGQLMKQQVPVKVSF